MVFMLGGGEGGRKEGRGEDKLNKTKHQELQEENKQQPQPF